MKPARRASWIELGLIGVATLAGALLGPCFPRRLAVGEIALLAAGLLLLQGLVRDVVRLRAERAARGPRGAMQRVRCTCVESAVGVGTIVAGGAMLAFGVERAYALPAMFWPAFTLAVGLLGFAIRDLVLDLDKKRIRREPAHSRISFS